MKPLVSILIPAFNAAEWIGDTLASAIGQTWPRKEIIVVEDSSADQTLMIAKRFASTSVKIVSQEHQGAAAARNRAFSLSQGDFIQWLDADDLLSPDKIEQQMSTLNLLPSKNTVLSSAWGRFVCRPSRARFVPTALWHDLTPLEWLLCRMEQNFHMQTSTWVVSRELTEAAGPWDTRLSVDDDGEYFCRVLLRSDGTRFVRDARVFYRMSGVTSLSYIGRSHLKMESRFRSMQLHIGYLKSLDDGKRARAACVRYLQNNLGDIYPDRLDLVEQAEQMAVSLGGHLELPRLPWKYWLLGALFGRGLAKRAQVFLPRIRWSLVRLWDKTLLRFE